MPVGERLDITAITTTATSSASVEQLTPAEFQAETGADLPKDFQGSAIMKLGVKAGSRVEFMLDEPRDWTGVKNVVCRFWLDRYAVEGYQDDYCRLQLVEGTGGTSTGVPRLRADQRNVDLTNAALGSRVADVYTGHNVQVCAPNYSETTVGASATQVTRYAGWFETDFDNPTISDLRRLAWTIGNVGHTDPDPYSYFYLIDFLVDVTESKPKIVVTFDDSLPSHYSYLYEKQKTTGIKATHSFMGVDVEAGSGARYTTAQANEMADSGLVDFICHASPPYYTLTASEIRDELEATKRFVRANSNLDNASYGLITYPSNDFFSNDINGHNLVETAMSVGMYLGRGGGKEGCAASALDIAPDQYSRVWGGHIATFGQKASNSNFIGTAAELQAVVEMCKDTGLNLVLMGHDIIDGAATGNQITKTDMEAMLDYLKAEQDAGRIEVPTLLEYAQDAGVLDLPLTAGNVYTGTDPSIYTTVTATTSITGTCEQDVPHFWRPTEGQRVDISDVMVSIHPLNLSGAQFHLELYAVRGDISERPTGPRLWTSAAVDVAQDVTNAVVVTVPCNFNFYPDYTTDLDDGTPAVGYTFVVVPESGTSPFRLIGNDTGTTTDSLARGGPVPTTDPWTGTTASKVKWHGIWWEYQERDASYTVYANNEVKATTNGAIDVNCSTDQTTGTLYAAAWHKDTAPTNPDASDIVTPDGSEVVKATYPIASTGPGAGSSLLIDVDNWTFDRTSNQTAPISDGTLITRYTETNYSETLTAEDYFGALIGYLSSLGTGSLTGDQYGAFTVDLMADNVSTNEFLIILAGGPRPCVIDDITTVNINSKTYTSADSGLDFAPTSGGGQWTWDTKAGLTETDFPVTMSGGTVESAHPYADWDGDNYSNESGLSQGVLLEGRRENDVTHSQNFSDFGWVVGTVTKGISVLAPDGSMDGMRIDGFTGSGSDIFLKTGLASISNSVISIWMKGTGTINLLYSGLTTNTVTLTPEWKRHYVAEIASSGSFLIQSDTGLTATSVDIWGAQREVGAFPSSYIKTTTGAITRNATEMSRTLASMGLPDLTDNFTIQLKTRLAFDSATPRGTSAGWIWMIYLGDSTDYFRLGFKETGSLNFIRLEGKPGGTYSVKDDTNTWAAGDPMNFVIRKASTGILVYLNGTEIMTDATQGWTNAFDAGKLTSVDLTRFGAHVDQTVEDLKIWPRALTDTEIGDL